MKKIFKKINLPHKWFKKLEILDVAFQPIININTAETYGVEALLRNYQEIGFQSIFSLLDKVYKEKNFTKHLRCFRTCRTRE